MVPSAVSCYVSTLPTAVPTTRAPKQVSSSPTLMRQHLVMSATRIEAGGSGALDVEASHDATLSTSSSSRCLYFPCFRVLPLPSLTFWSVGDASSTASAVDALVADSGSGDLLLFTRLARRFS